MPTRVVRFICCSLLLTVTTLTQTPAAPIAAHATRQYSLGTPYSSGLWPKVNGVATVFYVIDVASDPNATPNIQSAIKTFNADFPGLIQWVYWTSPMQGPNYVDINLLSTDLSGQCEALEGFEAVPAQRMWGSTRCTVGTIMHEMGHIIGLWHEQSRSDRATYIAVNYSNVIKGSWSNFQPPADNYQSLTPYDYASLMQYPAFSLSRNGGPVIETIPAGIPLNSSDGVPVPTHPDYSAADKEAIMRLYGAAPTNVTVTSNPAGLNVTADGSTFSTPKTFAWPLNSTHTLSLPPGVQTLTGYITNSKKVATFYYTYGRWNDSKLQSHTITVTPGNGELPFPSTSPRVATYSANFIQLVPYKAVVRPAKSGQVSVSPLPKSYPGVTGKFFVARQAVTLTATAAALWTFYEFNNAPFWLPGGLGANPKSFYVPDTGNPVNTTLKFSNAPVYSVSLTPDYATSNLSVTVDGAFAYTPKNFSSPYDHTWTPGSTHTLSFDSPASPYSINSRYAFVSWNGGGALARTIALRGDGASRRTILPRPASALSQTIARPSSGARSRANAFKPSTTFSQTITLPSSSAGYSATVLPQFAPATNFNYPPCGGTGTISPASPTQDGFYPTGQQLQFSAMAANGWAFAGWSYDANGMGNPASLTATDETLVFANFNTGTTPLTLTSLKPAIAISGSPGFTLTLTGSGFNLGSLVAFNGSYKGVTYVSSTQLKIPITAADVANPGAFQVFVENFPTGSTGCAVFGYQPFFVAQAH